MDEGAMCGDSSVFSAEPMQSREAMGAVPYLNLKKNKEAGRDQPQSPACSTAVF
jgi:hypothetical protein